MDQPSSSRQSPVVPCSSDSQKTREVNEIVGIHVLNLSSLVPEAVQESQESPIEGEATVLTAEISQPSEEDTEGWTEVQGKKSKSPQKTSGSDVPKPLLQLTVEDVDSEIAYWDTAIVCYVLGGNPPWELLEGFVRKLWAAYKIVKISFLPNGVFLVRFLTKECQTLVLQQGFPMFDNKPVVVKQWTESCSLHKERVKFVPIWVRLCGLPLKFWSKNCLSKLVGLLGKFLKRDGATEDKTRLGFARLLVEVEVGQTFPGKLLFLDEKGKEVIILVEYEWKPYVCTDCKGIGHTVDMCKKPVANVPKPAPGPPKKLWRPVQRAPVTQGPPPQPLAVPQALELPFGGPTYHRSSMIKSVSVVQRISRHEHATDSQVSPTKSYVEALSPRREESTVGTELNGRSTRNNFKWIEWHFVIQVITVKVDELTSGDSFNLSVVYGSNDEGERVALWDHLKDMKVRYQGPWVLNFNERIGREVTGAEVADFRGCVDFCGLMDLKGQGAFFTWTNKQAPSTRGYSRIDRFLVNDDWMDLYPGAYVHFLPEGLFDHNPCVCYRRNSGITRKRQFRYYNMWSLDAEFKNVVQQSWSASISGTPMYNVVTKLKNLKGPLKALNRNGFSDVDKSMGIARALLEDVQLKLQSNPSDSDLINAECEAADSYRHLCKIQHSFLSQKAKVDWLHFGDDNTRFFHSHIRAKQVHNRVLTIQGVDGVQYTDLDKIEDAFLVYYKSLLGSSMPTTPVHSPTVRKGKLVTQEHCSILLAEAPGPDGFSSQFFKDSWEIVGEDTIAAIKNFFQTGKLLKQVNTTNITLIPKSSNPTSVLDFRPIACCNTLYKALAKVLCKRLSKILPDIVSESQGGFVQGRNIVANVLICQDLVRLYNRKAASPRCLIKIDLKKAYDSVEWGFLSQMMTALNFPQKFIDLVMTCVTSPTYSLNVNGNKFGFFKGERGLRQGDPLSPLLFTICMEYLSRVLRVVASQDGFRFHPLCGHLKLNHLLFADDLLLFCKGNATSIMWILRAFATFSSASGLSLNRAKSEIYFNGVISCTITDILQISGIHRGSLPFKYLGVPISSKKLTKAEGQKLTDRIVARIRGWGTQHLTYAGRLTLVNSVLNTLHSYWASIFLIPNGILNRINNLCRNFLWKGSSDYKGAPNVNWDHCFLPKEEGGLGIKDIKKWNKALLGKYVWWLANKKDHLWVRWVSHVYMKDTPWNVYVAPSDCSWPWKKISSIMILFKQAYHNNLWLNSPLHYTVKAETSYTDRLSRRGMLIDLACPICLNPAESHQHLFYDCPFAVLCHQRLQTALKVQFRMSDLTVWYSTARRVSKLQKRYIGSCYTALVYWIWRCRNDAWTNNKVRCPGAVVKQILSDVRARFLALNATPLKDRDRAWFTSL
ncbi:uncharacterized protein LOC141641178 [Silene latifolia]|uniref:uncharacterized protein LOC141641178 n=1 Tax=Silene latifolia TaxID=37657 RepID=UPI003D775C3F